jgi:hypothetical protein
MLFKTLLPKQSEELLAPYLQPDGIARFEGVPIEVSEQRHGRHSRRGYRSIGTQQRVTLTVTLQMPLPLNGVTFRREGWLDRFAKSINFVFEAHTGDKSFDDQVYVECDNHILVRQLLQDAKRRHAVQFIVAGLANVSKLDLTSKGVAVTVGNYSSGNLSQSTFSGMLREMKQIGSTLPRLPGGFAMTVDSNTGKMLVGVPIVFLLLGLIAFLYGMKAYRPIDLGKLFGTEFSIAWKMALFYAIFCYFALKGRSRAVKEFVLSVFLGFLASVFSCQGSFVYLNGRLDRSAVSFHYVQLADKQVSRSIRRKTTSTSYWVTYPSWRVPGSMDRLSVTAEQYNSFNVNDYVRIETRAGRFGREWLVGIAPDPSGATKKAR